MIRNELRTLADEKMRDFSAKLIPTLDKSVILGVKTPLLRAIAKRLAREGKREAFLRETHFYFEEKQVHAFLMETYKDPAAARDAVEAFLPQIDNWATCDQMLVPALAKEPERLLSDIDRYLASSHTYTVRFGILMLMRYFLDARFTPEHLMRVVAVQADDYYVMMMCAWFFATALTKQPTATLPLLEAGTLPLAVHNKTISKACDSLRISDAQKAYLRTLRR